MAGETHSYMDGETALTAEVWHPAGPPRAAVLVLPTIMNATRAVEEKAARLAEAGYLAILCDLYGAQPEDLDAAKRLATGLRTNPVAYRRRLRAAEQFGRSLAPDLPMAAIGFCMGGQAALELARDGAEVLLCVSFHGLLDTDLPAQPGAIQARILVCYGDADALVPRPAVLAFWEEMDRAGADWHFHAYSGVPHGFTNPYPSPADGRIAYNASADRQSWQAMLSMLDEVLIPATGEPASPSVGARDNPPSA